jgi:hypothetical protein
VLQKKYERYTKTLPHTYSRTFKKMKNFFYTQVAENKASTMYNHSNPPPLMLAFQQFKIKIYRLICLQKTLSRITVYVLLKQTLLFL